MLRVSNEIIARALELSSDQSARIAATFSTKSIRDRYQLESEQIAAQAIEVRAMTTRLGEGTFDEIIAVWGNLISGFCLSRRQWREAIEAGNFGMASCLNTEMTQLMSASRCLMYRE